MASYIKRTSKKVKALGIKRNYSHNLNTGKTTRSTTTGLDAGNVRRTYIQSSDGKSKIRTTTKGVNGYVKVETKTLNAPKPPKPKKFKQPKYNSPKPIQNKTKKLVHRKSTRRRTYKSRYTGPINYSPTEKKVFKIIGAICLLAIFQWWAIGALLLWYGAKGFIRFQRWWSNTIDEIYDEQQKQDGLQSLTQTDTPRPD